MGIPATFIIGINWTRAERTKGPLDRGKGLQVEVNKL